MQCARWMSGWSYHDVAVSWLRGKRAGKLLSYSAGEGVQHDTSDILSYAILSFPQKDS